ncbi:MAG: IPT/TIG domain-containing protein [Labilithrix sp.]
MNNYREATTMKKLSLATVWVVITASIIALAVACSSTDAPAAFDPAPDGGGKTNDGKADASKDNPPPRPIDQKPDPVKPDDAPAPEVTSIDPDKAVLNGVGPTITVSGALFVPRSKVLVDGAEVATSYESETTLKATIPDAKLKAVAQLKISVTTAAPGGGTSAEVVFSVQNPKPELTALAPLSVNVNSGTTTLTLTGTNFVPGAKVRFGTSDIPSTTKNETTIEATIPSGLLGTSASVPVHVTNPFPGGGVTADIAFTISNPNSVITSVTPPSTLINTAGVSITVKGTGFVSNSKVLFNGTEVPTTQQASDSLVATVPADQLTTAGNKNITVNTPPPGGGLSSAATFTVNYPVPTVTKVEPLTAPAGGSPVDVAITGSKFFPNTKVTFNGVEAAVTFTDDKHLKATLTDLANAGNVDVKVINPTPGGGPQTTTFTIVVQNGIPKINALQPAAVDAVPVGGPDTPIDILGANFVSGITAKAGPGFTTTLAVTFVSSQKIQVAVPAALLKDPGTTVAFQLKNPAPFTGTGTSTGGPTLQVLCDSTDVIVNLNATTTETLQPKWDEAPKLSRFVAGSGACPTDVVQPEQQPARYVLVQNSTTSDLLLTAWGECQGGKGDGFVAFYKTGTEPNNDNERKACTGSISEGGSLPSPDANGSNKCPGLTKGNGALRLKACERAIVHVQAFSFEDASNPPPVNLKVKGELP